VIRDSEPGPAGFCYVRDMVGDANLPRPGGAGCSEACTCIARPSQSQSATASLDASRPGGHPSHTGADPAAVALTAPSVVAGAATTSLLPATEGNSSAFLDTAIAATPMPESFCRCCSRANHGSEEVAAAGGVGIAEASMATRGTEDAIWRECGPACACWRARTCTTSGCTHGVRHRLGVRRSAKGWGLHAEGEDVAAGECVCIYTGEYLNSRDAILRLQAYDTLGVGHALLVRCCRLYCCVVSLQ
jgi:hypothetical protein